MLHSKPSPPALNFRLGFSLLRSGTVNPRYENDETICREMVTQWENRGGVGNLIVCVELRPRGSPQMSEADRQLHNRNSPLDLSPPR